LVFEKRFEKMFVYSFGKSNHVILKLTYITSRDLGVVLLRVRNSIKKFLKKNSVKSRFMCVSYVREQYEP
jgi:hypothetical protein